MIGDAEHRKARAENMLLKEAPWPWREGVPEVVRGERRSVFILRHLLFGRSLLPTQGGLQHPKIPVAHNPVKVLLGDQKSGSRPAQHHLAISPTTHAPGSQAHPALQKLAEIHP
jgi:hypothetical protein